ncbi:MAG: hypothetical protein ACRCYS_14525, partial [Beijerinckiaceae bacterium]
APMIRMDWMSVRLGMGPPEVAREHPPGGGTAGREAGASCMLSRPYRWRAVAGKALYCGAHNNAVVL